MHLNKWPNIRKKYIYFCAIWVHLEVLCFPPSSQGEKQYGDLESISVFEWQVMKTTNPTKEKQGPPNVE